jgi:hypothetical protein
MHTGLAGKFATSRFCLRLACCQWWECNWNCRYWSWQLLQELHWGVLEWWVSGWPVGSCPVQNFSDENGNLMELTEHEISDEDWIVPYLTRSRNCGNRRAWG